MSAKKTDRNERIVEMHEQGMSYKEIVAELGISAARVFVIYQREKERKGKGGDAE
ncbi:MAG: helix-turn-helix domain-containing protein [Clostridia bacterium]|nr:helix-turn-helix domain-containing protein [Clostridia bacterium]